MLQANLNVQPKWETIEARGRKLQLLVKPLGRLLKLQIAGLIAGEFHRAMGLMMDSAILDWREVYTAPSDGSPPAPIPFSREGLDILLGLDDELGNAVQDRICQINGFAGKPDPTPAPASAGTESDDTPRPS